MKGLLSPQHSQEEGARQRLGYATDVDFQRLFAGEMTDLFRLSLQLTADMEKAESCLILAMRDCFEGSAVAKNWAHTWARRMVVRNAIRLLSGTENHLFCEMECEFHLQPGHRSIETMRESIAILELPEFDRLAFVICVLERYSILDCALLLRRTPRDVQDAIARATTVIAFEEQNSAVFEEGTVAARGLTLPSPMVHAEQVFD